MIELFTSDTYKVVIDEARHGASGDADALELRGWAADLLRKQALELSAPALADDALSRMSREDISAITGISPNEKVGFRLRVPANCPLVEMVLSSPGESWTVQVDMQRVRRTFALLRVRTFAGRIVRLGTGMFTAAGRARLRASIRRRLHLENREYRSWIKEHETLDRAAAERIQATFSYRPTISVVTPVYNVDEAWLRRCVASMQEQWYGNWELCLADDCSPNAHVRDVLSELAAADARVKVTFRSENGGISRATNSAIELATGEVVGFMDNDDELAPQALFEVVRALNEDPSIDFIYTDEDKIDEHGRRSDPFFKPGFSRQLLWGHNYITHFVVVRRELLARVGGLRASFDGSQDYDFVLRATAQATRVHHIPQILYHWRTIETSVAGDPRSKLYAYEAGRRALEESVRQAGFADATVEMLPNLGTYRVTYPIDRTQPVLVAVSAASADLVDEIAARTSYPACTVAVCADSAAVRAEAERAGAAFIVLLDRVRPAQDDWLDQMLGFMARDGVGLVGAKVLDAFNQVVNSGMTLRGLKEGVVFEGAGDWDGDVGYYFRTSLPRDLFALTEDCLCVRTEDFCALGGLDESLSPGVRGLDLSVRMRLERGKTCVWQPFSTLVCAGERYHAPSRSALAAYLERHPDLTDPFASAWFPPSHAKADEPHPLRYGIDAIARDGSVLEISGWAANTHSDAGATISVDDMPADAVTITRHPRLDVSHALLVPEDAPVGFTIRIATDANKVVLRLSIPEGEQVVPVRYAAGEAAVRRAIRRLSGVRHPRTFARALKRRLFDEVRARGAYRRYQRVVEPGLWTTAPLARRPLISIIVPVYNVEPRWLERCVDSIRKQTYEAWELCLADDCSTDPAVRPCLEALAASDERIKVTFRSENGHISRATNSALELATGEFVALMDNDDELPPQALYEVAAALDAHPELDLIYSDEDKIDDRGVRSDPTFKPDYSPDLLLSTNYISHLGVYRTSIVRAIGGFRPGFEGSQDYDLVLRFVERTDPARIHHIPRILYHWRMLATSTAADQGSKGYAFSAGQRALQDALDRRGLDASADLGPLNGIYNVHYRVPRAERVSVIIPTRDGYDNIERCVSSIVNKTAYEDFEIIIADNGSTNPRMRALYERYERQSLRPIRVVHIDIPFNYARINNRAAAAATGSYLLFLNDDTEVIAPGWMTTMVGLAQQERVGVVGAKLYYPNDRVQHAGVVLGLGGVAGHVFSGSARGDVGRYGRLLENANYYAVTAACCMISAADFHAVGGFDEDFAVAYNDVDLCIRVHDELGRVNVLAHEAELYHYESVTRGQDTADPEKRARLERESERFRALHGDVVAADPYFNENLSRTSPYLDVRTS